MQIGKVLRDLGFKTIRRHAMRPGVSDYIGCGLAWMKENDFYFLQLEVWLTDAYSTESPAIIGVDLPRFLLGRKGLVPYEGFETDHWEENLWRDRNELAEAIQAYFVPWAKKWTKEQTLIDFFLILEGEMGVRTEFPELPDLTPFSAPINAYYLARLYSLLGDISTAQYWTEKCMFLASDAPEFFADVAAGSVKMVTWANATPGDGPNCS